MVAATCLCARARERERDGRWQPPASARERAWPQPRPAFSPSPLTHTFTRRTPLHIAAAEGTLPAVEALVDAGADIGAKDRWGFTPLDEARREKRGPVIDFLAHQAGGSSGRR